MKRSEMVDDIGLTLRGYDDELITNSDYRKFASIILQVVESSGMLPPATDWLIKNSPEEMQWSEVNDYHIWEPEE